MAQKVEILITAKNMVGKAVKGARASLAGLTKGAGALVGGVGEVFAAAASAAVAFGAKAVSAYENQERALRNLASVHRMYGDSVGRYMAAEKKAASAIQDETGKGDEATLALMARLRMLGVAPAALEKAARATYGLAAAGMDEASAARAVAQAMSGNYQMLQRMSPEIRNAATETEKLDAFNRLCANGYKQLQNEMETTAGMANALKGRFGDLMEQLGRVAFSSVPGKRIFAYADKWLKETTAAADFVASAMEDPVAKIDAEIMGLQKKLSNGYFLDKQKKGVWGSFKDAFKSGDTLDRESAERVAKASAERQAAEKRLAELQAERARLMAKQREEEREAATQTRRDAEEDARAYQKVLDIHKRLVAAKRQYAEINAMNKDLEAARRTLRDLRDVQAEMNAKTKAETEQLEKSRAVVDRQIAREKEKLELYKKQRDELREALKLKLEELKAQFGAGFGQFRQGEKERREAEKEARRQERRNLRALKEGKALEEAIANPAGIKEKNLTRSQREKLEYWRGAKKLHDAEREARKLADQTGEENAQAVIDAKERRSAALGAAIDANNAKDFNAREIAAAEETIRQMEAAMRELPSASDVKSLVSELEDALREAKTSSNEWQKGLAENEAKLAEETAQNGEWLKTIEGVLRGQSEWLQKNLEGI